MYARTTKVPANQTRGEIENLLLRRGADQFVVGQGKENAMVMFEMRGWRVRFILPFPADKAAKKFTERGLAQEHRRRWRALLLVIKAKLEAVDSGIVEFEREFLPFIVTDARNNTTVYDTLRERGLEALKNGDLPPMLGSGSAS